MKTKEEEFDALEEKYTGDEDVETIKANREIFENSKAIEGVANTQGGKVLIQDLKQEITKSLFALFKTRHGKHVSDLESNLNLLTKLTGAKGQSDAISSWLESLQ